MAAVASTTGATVPPEGAVQGKVIGFIRPPPEIRTIVDKTAQFVAKHGDEFEAKIMAKEAANIKFAFLQPDHLYHAYYRHKIQEEREGPKPATAPAEPAPAPVASSAPAAPATASAAAPAAATVEVKRAVAIPNPIARALKSYDPAAAPASLARDDYAVVHPTYASGVELDTIKLTAQFTATGGPAFLSQLTQREVTNPAFAFLKPTHALCGYFTSLVDAYTRVLRPDVPVLQRLALATMQRDSIIERCVHKMEHKRLEEERKRAEAEDASRAVAAAVSIDWHDFVVVETLGFDDEEVEAMTAGGGAGAAATAGDSAGAAGGDAGDMDMDVDDSGGGGGYGGGGGVRGGGEQLDIREDYAPQLPTVPPTAPAFANFIDPRTGRAVPIESASEQLRIELMDPKWREQTARAAAKQATTGLAADEDVAANLRRLASKREDIFGAAGGAGSGSGGGGGRIGAAPPAKRPRIGDN